MENKENNEKIKTTEDNILNDQQDNSNLGNGRSIEKQIAVVFGKTLSIILVLIMAFVIYGSIFAPKMMASLSSKLGMQKTSLYYSKVQYNRDKDINSLYTVVNKSISLNNYKSTEKYLIKLFNTDNYYDFIKFVENENLKNVTKNINSINTISLMISMSNEDMYLKNKYVDSLVHNQKYDRAIQFALNDLFLNEQSYELGNRIHWCYTYLFNNYENLDYLTMDTKNTIENFVNMLYNKYLEKELIYNDLDTTQKFDFLVLQNSLKRILNDLIHLESSNVAFSGLSFEEIRQRINKLNS